MSAGECKQEPLSSNQLEFYRAWLDNPLSKPAASTLIELGARLAEVASGTPTPGLCSGCRNYRDPRTSTAQCRNLFCSQRCEQEFVRNALAPVTLGDCIRIQERLDTLLIGAAIYGMNCDADWRRDPAASGILWCVAHRTGVIWNAPCNDSICD